jgi:hypothetical protein
MGVRVVRTAVRASACSGAGSVQQKHPVRPDHPARCSKANHDLAEKRGLLTPENRAAARAAIEEKYSAAPNVIGVVIGQ